MIRSMPKTPAGPELTLQTRPRFEIFSDLLINNANVIGFLFHLTLVITFTSDGHVCDSAKRPLTFPFAYGQLNALSCDRLFGLSDLPGCRPNIAC